MLSNVKLGDQTHFISFDTIGQINKYQLETRIQQICLIFLINFYLICCLKKKKQIHIDAIFPKSVLKLACSVRFHTPCI